MKIVFVVEKSKGQSACEQTFQKPIVKIGRDVGQCDIAFDNREFRMVSRKHAEIRLRQGKWIVRDLGSSYGTFLDGRKITQPMELQVGKSVQFGANGPKVHVIWLESSGGEAAAEGGVRTGSSAAPEVSGPARRRTGGAELEVLTQRNSQHNPGNEIPEDHWLYRFAKKHWFFGFGAYT